MTLKISKIKYAGWPNNWQLSNGKVDLVVTQDVGPRVIRFGFTGGPNEFCEFADQSGERGGKKWNIFGGHRLWHAPEDDPRSYEPDNFSVKIEKIPGGIKTLQATEKAAGMQKEMEIRLHPTQPSVKITHRLINRAIWPVELAPGGAMVLPMPPRGTHPECLLPVNTLTLWAFTDMSDKRWTWGNKYVILRQDSRAKAPQKCGAMVPDEWGAYARGGHLFVKKARYQKGSNYPDWGCNFETFTNFAMLELETLGPLVKLEPGQAVEHVENWFLFDGISVPRNDADVDRMVLPRVKNLKMW